MSGPNEPYRRPAPATLSSSDAATLIQGLRDPRPDVRMAMFGAATRLPLDPDDWRAVASYANRAIAATEVSAESLAIIDAAPWLPLRSIRDRVRLMAASPDTTDEVRGRAGRSVDAINSRAARIRPVPESGSLLEPGWAHGGNLGFALISPDERGQAREAVAQLAAGNAYWRSGWRLDMKPLSPWLDAGLGPAIVTAIFERTASQVDDDYPIANGLVGWIEQAQPAFRPDLDGLFAVYCEAARDELARLSPDRIDQLDGFLSARDYEWGMSGLTWQIGWTVSRGGLRGLLTGLDDHLRAARPDERLIAAFLVADAADYTLQAQAPRFGGGANPDRAFGAEELIEEYEVTSPDAVESDSSPLEPVDVTRPPIIRGPHSSSPDRVPAVRPVSAATQTFERVASADFPSWVESGAENVLHCSIGPQEVGAVATLIRLEAAAEARELPLTLSVHAADFRVLDAQSRAERWFAQLTLDLTDPDAVATTDFVLVGMEVAEPRPSRILVNVWHANAPVGQLVLNTEIGPPASLRIGARQAAANGGDVVVRANRAPDADVVLSVREEAGGHFSIAVSREGEIKDQPLGEFPLRSSAWEYTRSLLDRFRLSREVPADQRRWRIDGLGLELWGQLPAAFHDYYWSELHGRPLSIAVYSQEPYIPWELIKPRRDRDGRLAPMLGEAFSMARWRDGRHFPNPLVVSRFGVIAPRYDEDPLEQTLEEANDLKREFGARIVSGSYSAVSRLLHSRTIQAVHFAGHGSFDPGAAAASEIRLVDRPIAPSDVGTATIGRSTHPLVFLNACEVGREGWSLTNIGGWAEAFCAIGCSAFVGPYWRVADGVARKASLTFYRALRSGATVGEAVRQVRLRFDEDDEFPRHPSWLAYSLHCQPNVTIRFDTPA